MDEFKLFVFVGMCFLARNEFVYEVKISFNFFCWWGLVWVVNNFMVCEGLCVYGFEEVVIIIVFCIIKILVDDIWINNYLYEYYDLEIGKGFIYLGFVNWNMLGVII